MFTVFSDNLSVVNFEFLSSSFAQSYSSETAKIGEILIHCNIQFYFKFALLFMQRIIYFQWRFFNMIRFAGYQISIQCFGVHPCQFIVKVAFYFLHFYQILGIMYFKIT